MTLPMESWRRFRRTSCDLEGRRNFRCFAQYFASAVGIRPLRLAFLRLKAATAAGPLSRAAARALRRRRAGLPITALPRTRRPCRGPLTYRMGITGQEA